MLLPVDYSSGDLLPNSNAKCKLYLILPQKLWNCSFEKEINGDEYF